MNRFPITKFDKDEWNKKVNACLMYTIASEDEALPILNQINQILTRLLELPLNQTLGDESLEFFFVQVFPMACQKIIKSRYFKNQQVLKVANQILQNTICLLPVHINLIDKIPHFVDLIQTVFPDQFYFKTNNQLDYKEYPYLYFTQKNTFQNLLQKGSKVDVIKFSHDKHKYFWTHGTVIQISQTHIYVQYDFDCECVSKKIQKNSFMLAPYQSQCTTFEWRKNLKIGDLADVFDSFGSWYNATVVGLQEEEGGRRTIQVTIKVYNQNGNKSDEFGKYFGFSDYKEKYDAFSAQIAPYCSVAKQFCYDSTKSTIEFVDDTNDMECIQIEGKKIYALPRKKNLSEIIFNGLNRFGSLGGFQKVLDKIEEKSDLGLLSSYLKGLSGVTLYLHKNIVIQQVTRLKEMLKKNNLSESQTYTKQKSEMLFFGLRSLLKRVHSNETACEYENNLKMKLVEQNFQNQSLKKRLQGLNELKQIVRTLTFGIERNQKIIDWIKTRKIFEKVYLINSHVQLIKKSENFFRYITTEGLLEVQDLEKLFKIAQKGDYQTRISLYFLFHEVSHIFKKPHVSFLIDKILQTDPHLTLIQDIDLLHELSKFSNYFPTKKVMEFFQKLVLAPQIPQQISNYSIKKYSEMVTKNYQMKSYKKEIIKDLFCKIKTHDIKKVAKILKFIYEGIAFGEWGRRDLTDMLQQFNFDEVMIDCIITSKQKKNRSQIIQECMDLLLTVYKLCFSFKIKIKTIEQIYNQIYQEKQLIEKYYKWCSDVFKCEQGIEVGDISQLIDLFGKLFDNKKGKSNESLLGVENFEQSIILEKLELLKSIFIEINKRKKFLTISTVMRDKEFDKQYKRKAPIKQLVFYDTLFQCIFDTNDSVAGRSLEFFKNLYCSGENTVQQIHEFLQLNLQTLKNNCDSQILSQTNKKRILQTLKIIQFLIDDSQKDSSLKIESLISKKKSSIIKLNFINSVGYSSDTVKKIEVSISSNSTLYDLRIHLAKQLDIPWKSVKIQLKKELPFLLNCRTIKELGLIEFENLTVSKKFVSSEPESQIIIDGEMNPKAIRVFYMIFQQYSTEGKMNKSQCFDFTVKCLGSASSPKFYENKISSLFEQYDLDQDEMLTFEDFLKFYKNSALSKQSIVWSNLRSFGVQGNFKFGYQANQQIKFDKIPRTVMSHMPEIYDLLFDLLKQKETAQAAFKMLERLPVSKHLEEQILSVNQLQFNFQSMFDTTDLYVFLYKLNIIQHLIMQNKNGSESDEDWSNRFTSNGGCQRLIQTFFRIIEIYEKQQSKILLQILDEMVDILIFFLMKCFITKPIAECQVLFLMDIELVQKIQYFMTGKFSQPSLSLPNLNFLQENQHPQSILHSFSKFAVLKQFLNLLQHLWIHFQSMNIDQSQADSTLFLYEFLIMKILSLLPALQINQNFQPLTSKMDSFINHSNSRNQKYIKKFYELILCVAFYTDAGKGQSIIVRQMFKHLTKPNIISEHFSILAILVSKFGVEAVNEQEIIDALMKNIFNSSNQLTIQGCARLMQNFDLSSVNQKYFDFVWENCLFGAQKKIKKNSTREALYEMILKSSENAPSMSDYIIEKVKNQISECASHMRITSCTEDNERSSTGYAGLKNLGNICYINSMMQQLYMNKNFRFLILKIKDNQPQNLVFYKDKYHDDNILHQIQRIFAYLQLTTRADYVPTGFCLAYKPFGQSVNVMVQQDVQEFISMFFDQLENKIKETPFKKVIDTFYAGKTINLFTCHDCNQAKKVEQNFYSITLQVKNSKTLYDSFNRYISGELISDFRCDFCNKKVDVSKKTRISKPPRTLLIHLQRIVFNLDTFINQKITARHEFPISLDLYPYSFAEYQKPKQMVPEQQKKIKDQMQYTLSGIISHIGNAESGHYISYIKIDENKWVQFNDSNVTAFSQNSIQSECFGGTTNNFIDEFEWDKPSETSKSAYVLLYERQGSTRIEAILKSLEQKQLFLKECTLEEVIQKIHPNNQQNQSSEDSQPDENQKIYQQIMELQVEEQIRKKSQDISFGLQKIQEIQKKVVENSEITVQINQNISCSIHESLKKQIMHDNQIHFFEKNLASPAFVKFFSHLLKQEHKYHCQIIKILKSLTFGFWMKSSNFKNLLKTCTYFIEKDFQYADDLIFQHPQIMNYLIENADSEVRGGIARFLADSFEVMIKEGNLTLVGESEEQKKIIGFLDNLFSLLPTTVSKSWTKFSQYFEFWYQFSKKGQIQVGYMIRKQILKHFLDYYLDKKSPLKIYDNKPQIGSKYANPNFTMLLKTISTLIETILNSTEVKLSKEDQTILINFDCMDKLISENSSNLTINLIKSLCKNNLSASEKVAIIILRGLHKSTFSNVQPYLEILEAYVLIQDNYQLLRMNWVLGKPTLHISTVGKQIYALSSYAFEQRVYIYHSSISLQQTSSLLDPIYELHKRAQNFAMMSLRVVLKLCLQSDIIFEYVWNLPPPTLCFGYIQDFYAQFVDKYLDQAKRSFSTSHLTLNKEQLGNQVKKLLNEAMKKWDEKHPAIEEQGIKQIGKIQLQSESGQPSILSEPKTSELIEKQQPKKNFKRKRFYPVKFSFIQKQVKEVEGLEIIQHHSELTLVELEPTGRSNDSFESSVLQKNIDKLKSSVWKTAQLQIIKGYFVYNKSKNSLRLKTNDGTQLIKPNEYGWIWANQIEKVWICQKNGDWPKWDLYSKENNLQIQNSENAKSQAKDQT